MSDIKENFMDKVKELRESTNLYDEDPHHIYHIETPAKTKTGWKRVKDTAFGSEQRAKDYGNKYHTDSSGSKMYRVGKRPRK